MRNVRGVIRGSVVAAALTVAGAAPALADNASRVTRIIANLDDNLFVEETDDGHRLFNIQVDEVSYRFRYAVEADVCVVSTKVVDEKETGFGDARCDGTVDSRIDGSGSAKAGDADRAAFAELLKVMHPLTLTAKRFRMRHTMGTVKLLPSPRQQKATQKLMQEVYDIAWRLSGGPDEKRHIKFQVGGGEGVYLAFLAKAKEDLAVSCLLVDIDTHAGRYERFFDPGCDGYFDYFSNERDPEKLVKSAMGNQLVVLERMRELANFARFAAKQRE